MCLYSVLVAMLSQVGTITSKSRDRDSKYDVYKYVLDVNDGIDRGGDTISPA